MTTEKFYGIYRGVVVSNEDPLSQGRLKVRVQDLLDSLPVIWAEPSTPLAGSSSGMYVVPPSDTGVWIQFAGGDVACPVWTGFWRGSAAEVPAAAWTTPPGTPQIVLGTPDGNSITITDLPGPTGGFRIQLRGPEGPFIRIADDGIELSCGQGKASIRLTGMSVVVNDGALVVT